MVGICLTGVLIATQSLPLHAALRSGVVGTGTPASCTESALDSALAGGGNVTFNCGAAPTTITLTATKNLISNTSLDGAGLITLRGSGSTRLLYVNGGVTLTLRGIVLDNGRPNNGDSDGGAIYNIGGSVVLNNSTIRNSHAGSGRFGGAVALFGNNPNLTVINSTIISNSASAGGAIYNGTGLVFISNSVVANNILTGSAASSGGAIYSAGTLHIASSTLSNNHGVDGGAIYVAAESSAVLSSTLIFSNSASNGAGIETLGALTITDSLIDQNSATDDGGGLWLFTGSSLNMHRSTLSGNRARVGGAINNNSALSNTLRETTISNNTSTGDGGGIYSSGALSLTNVTLSGNVAGAGAGGGGGAVFVNGGVVTLTFVTVAENKASFGAGIYNKGGGGAGGQLFVRSSLLAKNTGGDCDGVIESLGYNIAGDNNCGAFTKTGDAKNANVALGPLTNNSGNTQTHVPLSGNVAINRVPTNECNLAIDQRGAARPNPANGACDSGAVEAGGAPALVYLPLARK
jgi:predicted outer membrane repeat protein